MQSDWAAETYRASGRAGGSIWLKCPLVVLRTIWAAALADWKLCVDSDLRIVLVEQSLRPVDRVVSSDSARRIYRETYTLDQDL
jgi:hypothetical protein